MHFRDYGLANRVHARAISDRDQPPSLVFLRIHLNNSMDIDLGGFGETRQRLEKGATGTKRRTAGHKSSRIRTNVDPTFQALHSTRPAVRVQIHDAA
jgi:hypothetical protein